MTKEQKILLLLVLIVGGAGALLYVTTGSTEGAEKVSIRETVSSQAINKAESPSKEVVTQNQTAQPVVTPAPSTVSQAYTSTIDYQVPDNGKEQIHVVLVVKSGVIEDVRFTFNPPSERESGKYLNSFSKAIQSQGLTGKKLADISLSRVGGASLTTAAFMKAVKEINGKIGV